MHSVTVTLPHPYGITGKSLSRPVPISVRIHDAHMVSFERFSPIKTNSSCKGQHNFSRFWWCATTGDHVPFSSWVHRVFLISADYDCTVVGLASRPFCFWFYVPDGRRCSHCPDFFLRLVDGSAVVVDVGDCRQSSTSSAVALCAQVGWRYIKVGEQSPIQAANLRWLAGYRHPRNLFQTLADSLTAHLAATGPSSIGGLAAAVGEPMVVLPTLYHLMWHQKIRADVCTTVLTMLIRSLRAQYFP